MPYGVGQLPVDRGKENRYYTDMELTLLADEIRHQGDLVEILKSRCGELDTILGETELPSDITLPVPLSIHGELFTSLCVSGPVSLDSLSENRGVISLPIERLNTVYLSFLIELVILEIRKWEITNTLASIRDYC